MFPRGEFITDRLTDKRSKATQPFQQRGRSKRRWVSLVACPHALPPRKELTPRTRVAASRAPVLCRRVPRLLSGQWGAGNRQPWPPPPTFADDEATLVRRHGVGYLLDATRGSQAPVAAATASAPGHRKAPEAVSLLGKKQRAGEDPATPASATRGPRGAG